MRPGFNYTRYDYNSENKLTIHCIHCTRKMRVPSNKGKIAVTCPNCRKEFLFNPNSIGDTLKQVFAWAKSGLTRKRPFRR